MRSREKKELIEEKVLENEYTDINLLTKRYIKYLEEYKNNPSKNIEALRAGEEDHYIEILEGDNRISFSPVF